MSFDIILPLFFWGVISKRKKCKPVIVGFPPTLMTLRENNRSHIEKVNFVLRE